MSLGTRSWEPSDETGEPGWQHVGYHDRYRGTHWSTGPRARKSRPVVTSERITSRPYTLYTYEHDPSQGRSERAVARPQTRRREFQRPVGAAQSNREGRGTDAENLSELGGDDFEERMQEAHDELNESLEERINR